MIYSFFLFLSTSKITLRFPEHTMLFPILAPELYLPLPSPPPSDPYNHIREAQEAAEDARLCARSSINTAPEIEEILRADECRLMYLSYNQCYTVSLLFPLAPFGSIVITDISIDVRQYALASLPRYLCFTCVTNLTHWYRRQIR
jgi:hypothetical protein